MHRSILVALWITALGACGEEPPQLADDTARVDLARTDSGFDVTVTRGSRQLARWSVGAIDAELGARIVHVLRDPAVPTRGLIYCPRDRASDEASAALAIELPDVEQVRCLPDRSNCPGICPE